MNRIVRWFNSRFPLQSLWKRYFTDYYVPGNLNLWYVFGALALLVVFNQMISGLWLSFFYSPNPQTAFDSIESIMRDVNYGWLIRYLHTTGASVLFIVLYLHLFRGLLYGSYKQPRELVWILGMLLLVCMLAAAVCGYLLPWGQMSYWGAEVIISVLSSIPYIGEVLANAIRGDYWISAITLQRFYSLHCIVFPFLIFILIYLHIVSLHQVGSNNPEGRALTNKDYIPFYPYYVMKDVFAMLIFLIIFLTIVFIFPKMGGYFIDFNNLSPANVLVTPEHINPMWYLAPFYAILRAIPDKLSGIFTVFSAILFLFLLPWIDRSQEYSMRYKGRISKAFFFSAVIAFLGLMYLGTAPLNSVNLICSRIAILFYFAYFLFMPFYTRYENLKNTKALTNEP